MTPSTPGTVHALLVGIDAYRAVRPLRGAANDIRRVGDLLDSMAAHVDPLSLVDEAATRAVVVAGISTHLGRARAGDTALFWFSGHGSQRPAPPQWDHREPSGFMQTLVCCDSRTNGVPDLDDKDLAELLRAVAAGGAHVVAVLDCCHAEGGTRATKDLRVRGVAPWDPGDTSPLGSARTATPMDAAPTHVLLAACRAEEPAYEINTSDGDHGAFTAALLDQLGQLGPAETYRDLLTAASCQVERMVSGQRPVLLPATGMLVDQPFLGGFPRRADSAATLRHTGGHWQIDVGACHGLTPPNANSAEFAVVGATPRRIVRVLEVSPTHSRVALIGWEPGNRSHFSVVPVRLPEPHGTPHVRVVPDRPGRVRIIGDAGTEAVVPVPALDAALTHVTRWRMTKHLDNPASRLSDAVRMDVYAVREDGAHDESPLRVRADGVLALSYREHGPELRPPRIRVRLHNSHDKDLYCVLLDLTDRFACHADLFPGAWLGAHRVAWAAYGEPVEMSLPEPPSRGASTWDWLRLVVAERPFSCTPYLLPRLDGGAVAVIDPSPNLRDLTPPARVPSACDWATAVLSIVCSASSGPLSLSRVDESGPGQHLGELR